MKSQYLQFVLKVIAITVLFILSSITSVRAETYQSHSSIYWAAKDFLKKQIKIQHGEEAEIKTSKLDSRLKLKKCSKYLQAYMPKGSRTTGRTTVGVKCTGKQNWSLNVPVTVSIFKNVLAASRQLQKDTMLTRNDMKSVKQDIADLPYGYYENMDRVIGMKLKRRVQSGDVITPSVVKKPRIVSRGQKITILAQSQGIVVRMMGEALEHGAAGERIRVVNLKSRKKLEGIVTTSGEVKVEI